MISMALPSNNYLINVRKLDESVINTFGLSYCDPNGEIYVSSGFEGKIPSLSKVFYNSVVFPVQSLYSDVISVSVRPLSPNSNSPKYINLPYEKANHLYGLNITYNDIIKEKKAYVVEGNLSMLTPWKNGIKNIVAMLGSNISHTQLCLLSRFAKKVVFVSDGDKAGRNFIEKVKKNIPSKFYNFDLDFSYIALPDGLDPDDYIKQFGKEEFLKLQEKELLI